MSFVTNRLQHLIAFALIFIAGSGIARADIVFVNMNNATQELAAVKAMAQKTGERVYILPDSQSHYQPDNGQTEKGLYQTPQLTEDIIRLAKSGVRPRSMVFSGHHVEGLYFYGSSGGVHVHRLKQYLEEQPASPETNAFFSSITSLHLWGCYSGTFSNTQKLTSVQDSPFLNLKSIFGFLKKGPLGTSTVSGNLLRDSLTRSEQILRTADRKSKSDILKKVVGSANYDLVVYQGDSIFTKSSVNTREDFIRNCQAPRTYKVLTESVQLINKYNEGLLPIPDSTYESPLRDAYQKLQEYNYCLQMKAIKRPPGEDFIPVDNVVRLIFYKNIMANFARLYAKPLQYISQKLASKGIEHAEVYTHLADVDRSTLISLHNDIYNQINNNLGSDENLQTEQGLADMLYLRKLIEEVRAVIYPSEEFVPEAWKDPGAVYGSGTFKILGHFPDAWAAANSEAHCIWNNSCPASKASGDADEATGALDHELGGNAERGGAVSGAGSGTGAASINGGQSQTNTSVYQNGSTGATGWSQQRAVPGSSGGMGWSQQRALPAPSGMR
jgi:hypothetical protein